ncbi:peptidoglycan-binding protein [Bacillus cereus]|uniref:peptidoglycan-binding protein n=1 Tax=Bacillus cereus TaxID=1396 RepID=UPI002ABFDD52|nr:peptidoglycan-binding protein [Bacillus cereus]MDZ4621725.1 peptidoglycan-binding protein [Bacillus cereus]
MNYYNQFIRQSTGTLMIYVFEGNKVKPIVGATVTITGNNQNITLQTNESGQTKTVTLPAEEPYTKYSIRVIANGYNSNRPLNISGIQVVPKGNAIQEVQMISNRQINNYRPQEEIKIPPHKLTQPDPIKPEIDPLTIPDPQQSQQLRPQNAPIGVLIPEYIIVHCGAPQDRSAPKYKVKFTDYITKVACAEIYSSWHKEALIANTLCIISYTLNKVFTQTYEGFDVTCKIQFDHKYDPSQTVYKEIVEIVDTIFNQYIKHPDPLKLQPFLTEYRAHYDRKTPCKLGQYKSEELAKEGRNHQDILNYFYDLCYGAINIRSAEGIIFQGRPTQPPGTILKEGTSGADVREIQVLLNEISKKYNKIPKLQTDGKFGASTTKAVKTFQEIFIVPQDGIVDFRTWYKITNLYYSILDFK